MTVDDLGDDGSYYLGDDGSYHLGDDGSYYLDVRRPQILEARKAKAKSAREEAEESKLGRAPATDDTNAGPWYQRRLPSTKPKALMILALPLVGLWLLGISLSLLDKIFLLARGIPEVLPEAGSSKKTLAGGEGKGAPSSA